ncbi:MAG: hypothetical protein IPJ81_13010 [Chitinophagaceae bacterium]|nr:hypothetical protein [Chitinophagaceae bacterium]
MKRVFQIIFLFGIYSCNSKKEKELTQKEKQQSLYNIAEIELSNQKEKIALLSFIKKIQYDTLYLILKDYYAQTWNYSYKEDSVVINCSDVINSISKKYNFPKAKVANLIFNFKYEMQTKQDIIDEFQEKQQYEEEQYQEEYDPR